MKANKKSHGNVQWMFIGSRVTESLEADAGCKLRDKMGKKEMDQYSSYLSIEENAMPILLDEKKCISMFSRKYGKYESLLFHKTILPEKRSLKQKISQFFQSKSEASLIVFSGHANPKDGSWLIENFSTSQNANVSEEVVTFEDVMEAWKVRNKTQKHLLIIIDSNYSGHWVRKLPPLAEVSISIQASCRYWQKSVEDKNIGGYFLHNLSKIVRDVKQEQVKEPINFKQNPCFYGHFHYVVKIFGLILKFESWQDMRQALSEKEYGNWPRIKGWVRTPHTKLIYDPEFENYLHEQYFLDKDGNRYEGNVDKYGEKDGIGTLYTKNGTLLYEGLFKNDMMQNKGTLYHPEGQKWFEGVWVDNVLIGDAREYAKEGYLNYVGPVVDYVREGEGKEYNKYGRVKYEGNFTKGIWNGKAKEYHDNGSLKTEGNFLFGKLHGPIKEYNDQDFLIFEGDYTEGNRNGPAKTYYQDGKLHFDGTFFNNFYHGRGKIYSKTGELQCEGEFVHGQLQGMATTYYLNGNVLFNGEFENGKAIPVGFLRNEDGSIHKEGKQEDVVREVLTTSIYQERRKTKKFEDKQILVNTIMKSELAKTNFLLQTSQNPEGLFKQSALLNSSYVRRQSLDRTFETQGLDIKTTNEIDGREKLNPLNPKGKNDLKAEKNLKAVHTIDYKKKRMFEKLEKDSLKIDKTNKLKGNGSINSSILSEKKHLSVIENILKVDSPQKISINSAEGRQLIGSLLQNDELNPISITKNSNKELLNSELHSPSKEQDKKVSKDSFEAENTTNIKKDKKSLKSEDFEKMYKKKFESDDDDKIIRELYGHAHHTVEWDKLLEVKKEEPAPVKLPPPNPFLQKHPNINDKRDSGTESEQKRNSKEVVEGQFKKVSTEPKFEFIDSFRDTTVKNTIKSSEKVDKIEEIGENVDQVIQPEWLNEETDKRISVVSAEPPKSVIYESELVNELDQKNLNNSRQSQSKASFGNNSLGQQSFGNHSKKKSIRAKLQIADDEGVKTYLMNF